MATFLIFLVCLVASTLGGLCGIGGGIIIKPLLDAAGLIKVDAVSFLSGLTVLSMSVVAVVPKQLSGAAPSRLRPELAVGAALGGVAGQRALVALRSAVGHDTLTGMVQAILLLIMTLLTFFYLRAGEKREKARVENRALSLVIGAGMGAFSAFLGIGGGPINLAVLFFFFSMETREAAYNSLNIILLSQLASLAVTLIRRDIPDFPTLYLPVMVAAGLLGGILVSRISCRMDSQKTAGLFRWMLLIVAGICLYNAVRFGVALG